MNKLITKSEKKDLSVAEKFDAWMINKVKSIHYANNEKMMKAHETLFKPVTNVY